MPARKDITGQRFGRLVAIRRIAASGSAHATWECRCDCGRVTYPTIGNLGAEASESCGKCDKRGGRPRVHAITNEGAFEESSEGALYFAGLLFADGCVFDRVAGGRKETGIVLSLSGEDDRAVIEQLRDFLGSSHPIRVRRPGVSKATVGGRPIRGRKAAFTLSITSKRIAASLSRFGVVPRKTYTATVPEFVQNNPHWWRGCVDGDGWVVENKDGALVVGFCGARQPVEAFARYVEATTGARGAIHKNSGHCWRTQVTGRRAVALARLLYENCTVSLPRKRLAYIRHLADAESRAFGQRGLFFWA